MISKASSFERVISAYREQYWSALIFPHLGGAYIYLSPAARSSAIAVLDQQVGGANLALGDARDGTGSGTGTVVLGHVVLQLLRVGAGGGLPAGNLVDRVEVVWEVLGVGVTDFPVGRQAGVRLFNRARNVSHTDPDGVMVLPRQCAHRRTKAEPRW